MASPPKRLPVSEVGSLLFTTSSMLSIAIPLTNTVWGSTGPASWVRSVAPRAGCTLVSRNLSAAGVGRDQVEKTKVAETSVNVIVHDVRHVRMRYLLRLKKNEDDA